MEVLLASNKSNGAMHMGQPKALVVEFSETCTACARSISPYQTMFSSATGFLPAPPDRKETDGSGYKESAQSES